jgi:hypothetical protein
VEVVEEDKLVVLEGQCSRQSGSQNFRYYSLIMGVLISSASQNRSSQESCRNISQGVFGTISTMSSRGHKREEVIKIQMEQASESLEVPLATYPSEFRCMHQGLLEQSVRRRCRYVDVEEEGGAAFA